MSILSLRSGDMDDPANFSNQFKEGVKLDADDTIELVSASIIRKKDYQVIQNQNDDMYYRLGDATAYSQVKVTLDPGSYSGPNLATHIQNKLNESVVLGVYKGGFDVSVDVNKFTISYSEIVTPTQNTDTVTFETTRGSQFPTIGNDGKLKKFTFPQVTPGADIDDNTDFLQSTVSDRGLFSNGGINDVIIAPLPIIPIDTITDGDYTFLNWISAGRPNFNVTLDGDADDPTLFTFSDGPDNYTMYFNFGNGTLTLSTPGREPWRFEMTDLNVGAGTGDFRFTEVTFDLEPIIFTGDGDILISYTAKSIYPSIRCGSVDWTSKFIYFNNEQIQYELVNNEGLTGVLLDVGAYNYIDGDMDLIIDNEPYTGNGDFVYGTDHLRLRVQIDKNTGITLRIAHDSAGDGIFLNEAVIAQSGDDFSSRIKQRHYPLYSYMSCTSGSLIQDQEIWLGGIYDSSIVEENNASLYTARVGYTYPVTSIITPGDVTAPSIFKMGKLTPTDIYNGPQASADIYQISNTLTDNSAEPNDANMNLLLGTQVAYNFSITPTVTNSFEGSAIATSFTNSNLHLEIEEFNIKSYNGNTGDSVKDIYVIPKEQWESFNDIYGELYFQAPYPIPIKLNLSNTKSFNQLSARLRLPDGRIESDLQSPTTLIFKITKGGK